MHIRTKYTNPVSSAPRDKALGQVLIIKSHEIDTRREKRDEMMLNLNLSRVMIPLKLSSPTTTTRTNNSNRKRRRKTPALGPASVASCSNFADININSPRRIDTENLRTQLDQLHAEAEATRSKGFFP